MSDPPNESRPTADTRPVSSEQGRQILRFSSLAPGAEFAGRYRIEERLGSGGAGEVYRVHDRVAGVELALKVLFPSGGEGADPLARLQRELRLIRELNHPGILRIHDVGEHEGLLYLVMDLLEGESLSTRLAREGRLPVEQTLHIAEGLLDALATAHAQGVIHRDVKPGNVFLAHSACPQGGAHAAANSGVQGGAHVASNSGVQGGAHVGGGSSCPELAEGRPTRPSDRNATPEQVVLLDFGLARQTNDLSLTATGQFLGTPEYVSPEQARGENVLTTATDIYSAGIVIWEMLSGRTPYAADSAAEVIAAHATAQLPNQRRALPDAPDWLRRWLAWVLEKIAKARPADGARALEALRARQGAGWLAQIRRRWLNARLLARVAVVTALVVLLTAALLPCRLVVERSHAVRKSLLGLSYGPVDLPSDVAQVVPFGRSERFTIEYLVPFSNRARPARYHPGFSSSMAIVNAVTGKVRPFLFHEGMWPDGPRHWNPYFDQVLTPTRVSRVHQDDCPEGIAEQCYSAIFNNPVGSPHLWLMFGERGQIRGRMQHPGNLTQLVRTRKLAGEESALHVTLAANTSLGSRRALLGFHPYLTPSLDLGIPPFLSAQPRGRTPHFYTFLSENQDGVISLAGEEAVLRRDKLPDFRFEVRTGVPLDARDRGGLSKREWLTRQEELLDLMQRAETGALPLSARENAKRFDQWIGSHQLAPSQRGVALSRAAHYLQLDGQPERALPLVAQAIKIEPDIPGHYRQMIYLLTRIEGWRAARQAVIAAPSRATWDLQTDRELCLGVLLTGTSEEIDEALSPIIESLQVRTGYYSSYVCALQALHEDRAEEVAHCIEAGELSHLRLPEFEFLAALAQLQLGNSEQAFAWIDAHLDGGSGTGTALTGLPLRSCLAAMGVGDAPDPVLLEQELADQLQKSRLSLLSWYFLVWQEGLLARAAYERGDHDSWQERLKTARDMHGAGPWLERLAGERLPAIHDKGARP